MRTTFNIDDEALTRAMKFAKGRTKTDVINEALRRWAAAEHLKGMRRLRGKAAWIGDLDEMRERTR